MRSRSRSPVRRDRRHSRSRSHSRERYERRDDRYRDRDRKRDDRKRSRSRSPVKRNRSPRRSRSRSPRRRDKERERDKSRYSDRSRDISPKRGQRSEEPSGIQSKATGVESAPGSDEDEDMMKKMMGFTGFDSTKGKHVKGQMDGTVKISRTKKYRQYMNRRGGFNRPLDHVN